jgi:hypothetical protein
MLARRELGDRGAVTRPVLVAAAVLILAGGLLCLPFLRPDLALALIDVGQADVAPDLQRYRLGFLGFEALVTFALALGSLAVLALHRARRAREWWLAAAVLLLVVGDLYRTGHRFVVTASTADLYRPPAVAVLPAPSARLWTDRLFFPDSSPERFDVAVAGSIPVSFIPNRDQLYPYWANLWGIPYALNEDFDLMLTTPARHALDVFRTRTKLAEQGINDLAMAYLGAWNACNVARRRAPETLAEEYRRTGIPPQRVRIVGNPFCLDRFRFVPAAELHSDSSSATAAAQEHGFDVSKLEFLVAGTPAPVKRSYAEGARLTNVDENGADVDLDYSASGPSLLVAAMTYDRNWRASVDGNRTAVLQTAIGQMAIEVPAGTHRASLRYRDPWVVAGAVLSLVGLGAAIFIAKLSRRDTRASAAPPLPRA